MDLHLVDVKTNLLFPTEDWATDKKTGIGFLPLLTCRSKKAGERDLDHGYCESLGHCEEASKISKSNGTANLLDVQTTHFHDLHSWTQK